MHGVGEPQRCRYEISKANGLNPIHCGANRGIIWISPLSTNSSEISQKRLLASKTIGPDMATVARLIKSSISTACDHHEQSLCAHVRWPHVIVIIMHPTTF